MFTTFVTAPAFVAMASLRAQGQEQEGEGGERDEALLSQTCDFPFSIADEEHPLIPSGSDVITYFE
jgi:hypothetical protein